MLTARCFELSRTLTADALPRRDKDNGSAPQFEPRLVVPGLTAVGDRCPPRKIQDIRFCASRRSVRVFAAIHRVVGRFEMEGGFTPGSGQITGRMGDDFQRRGGWLAASSAYGLHPGWIWI